MSDSLNHKSIVEGVKQSTAKVIGFKHNDMRDLENVLDRETRKWWRSRVRSLARVFL